MSLRIFSFFQNDSYFIKVTILTVRSELGWKNAKGMTRKTVGLRAAIRALPDAPAPGPRSGSCLTRPLASGIRASVSFANRTRWTEQKGEISMLMRRWRLACLPALCPLLPGESRSADPRVTLPAAFLRAVAQSGQDGLCFRLRKHEKIL